MVAFDLKFLLKMGPLAFLEILKIVKKRMMKKIKRDFWIGVKTLKFFITYIKCLKRGGIPPIPQPPNFSC